MSLPVQYSSEVSHVHGQSQPLFIIKFDILLLLSALRMYDILLLLSALCMYDIFLLLSALRMYDI